MYRLLVVLLLITSCSFSQREFNQWHFCNQAGVDFNTSPPSPFLGVSGFTSNTGTSVADTSGNLLFYANCCSVWDKSHSLMANGNLGPSVQTFAVKQPGNQNIFYLFQTNNFNAGYGIKYSVIDMSLASGNGSVTVKDVTLTPGNPGSRRFTAIPHANNNDMWVIFHEYSNNNFISFLLTSNGLASIPVISGTGYIYGTADPGFYIGASSNGRKIACSVFSTGANPYFGIEIYDFNRATGVVSNALNLGVATQFNEFSPDGTKLYAIKAPYLFQWDLCAGSATAIINSVDTIEKNLLNVGANELKLGPDGKLYSSSSSNSLAVVNFPNKKGNACNFFANGFGLGGKTGTGLPRFYSNSINKIKGVFEFSIDTTKCTLATFTSPCLSSGGYSNSTWLFGDPASGTSNTSQNAVATHSFSSPGNYKVKLVRYGPGFSDTLEQFVSFPTVPNLTITGKNQICKNEITTLTVLGAGTYSWSSGAFSSTAQLNPTVTSVYTITGTFPNQHCKAIKSVTVTVNNCLLISNKTGRLTHVYPSPASDFINYEIMGAYLHNYRLLDIFGRIAKEGTNQEQKNSLYIQDLTRGLYFLEVKIQDRVFRTPVLLN